MGKYSKKKTVNRLKWLIPLVLVLAIAVGVLIWYAFIREPTYDPYEFDTEAIEGRIQNLTPEEIQAELNRVVEDGMFNISIASAIVFNSPKGEGEARIENIEANRYHMQVDIVLDETGEKVYASKLIKPGYSIANIRLTEELEPGEYDATAVFSAITQEEKQLYGQAAAKIKIYILDEFGRIPTRTTEPTETTEATE